MTRQGEDSLDNGGGRGNSGDFGQNGQEGFPEWTAHLEVRLAGQKFDAGLE